MILARLRIQPGQARLTPEQKVQARHFAEGRIATHLSMEPVHEAEAEVWLRRAYQVAGRAAPAQVRWLDGPLPLVSALLAAPNLAVGAQNRVGTGVGERVRARIETSITASVGARVEAWVRANIEERVRASVWEHVGASIQASVGESVKARIGAGVEQRRTGSGRSSIGSSVWESVWACVWESVRAYHEAAWLASTHFFAVALAPNALQPLARFNELVSGYWLGPATALLVRRPLLLARDAAGRLHSATGKCVEYRDGWSCCYAWHGVRVPARVILAPDDLTRDDFQSEPNLEVRRVIQERMGSRFVRQLGGSLIDTGTRGSLYEVPLPGDPERIARYVQVQDASTARQYFLRVPPTVQTAAEAVAWSFQMALEEYGPAHET